MQTNTIEVDALANVHSHLREGEVVRDLIRRSIQGGADTLLPMPNTIKPLTTAKEVTTYIKEAERLVPSEKVMNFIPTVMITEETTEKGIDDCIKANIVDGKVMPKDRTHGSGVGVEKYGNIFSIVNHCGKVGMKVHLHPEHPSPRFTNRDAEFAFLPIIYMFLEETNAIIIWEHGTDSRCIPHWEKLAESDRFFLTLTAHHLATNEDEAFGDVRSVCKPPIKTESDRLALVDLVEKNYSWIMAGGDDAFHDTNAKHVNSGRCACGAYTAPFLHPLYAHSLDKLFETPAGIETYECFTSRNARKLHNLPLSSRWVKLTRESWRIPLEYSIATKTAVPFWAARLLKWKIVS